MGLIENFIRRRRERNEKEDDYEDLDKIHSNIERKKLSHAEREVRSILKKEHEESLKDFLRWDAKKNKAEEILREREFMRGNGGMHLMQ